MSLTCCLYMCIFLQSIAYHVSAHLRAININMANKGMFTIPTDASIVCIDVRFIWFAFSINIFLFVPNGIFISVCHYCNHWKQLSKYFVSYVSKNIWIFYFSTTGFLLSKLSATLWHFNNIILGCFYLWPQHLVHLLPKCCLCGFCFCFGFLPFLDFTSCVNSAILPRFCSTSVYLLADFLPFPMFLVIFHS